MPMRHETCLLLLNSYVNVYSKHACCMDPIYPMPVSGCWFGVLAHTSYFVVCVVLELPFVFQLTCKP